MIHTEDLTKQYGSLFAVKQLQIDLKPGDLFGFIGPNGSGKTTTMKILATLLQPTYGEAYVCDRSIYTHPKEIRMLIGYMPDFFGVYDDMTVIEYLEFFAAAYRIRGEKRKQVCHEMLELVDLGYKRDAMATSLSRGMTQRLGLARVLLHDPQVLLLDEPASGLDPRARIEMRELLKRLGGRGKTVMVSSHILPELADICNKVGIIERGELLVNAEVADVMRRVRDHLVIQVEVVDRIEEAAKLLEQHGSVMSVEIQTVSGKQQIRLSLNKDRGLDDYSDLPALLIQHGFRIRSFKEDEINLETAFMTLTKGITA
ncbi:MAG: ABC transporter ATP-binding protein [Planctomycetaceae bacterium]|jgi:ABC-2 type transport system ATP-binding protein|nr:ABC transporter ATP-binding protein [Planctomycetaceae bacterium]